MFAKIVTVPGLSTVMVVPPVAGSACSPTAVMSDADQTTFAPLTPTTTAGTWKVCVVEPGIDAEYIGLNAMTSESGLEQLSLAPPAPPPPSGDAPDEELDEHAAIPPPTAHAPTLMPTAQATRYEKSFMDLPFGRRR